MPDLYVRCKCCCCHNRSDCRVQFIGIYLTCITIVLATFHPVSCSEGSVQIFPGKDLRPVYSDSAQLNSTELNSTAWTTVDSVCRSWRHKQKHDWLGCTLFNWVSWVQLSCVAINAPLVEMAAGETRPHQSFPINGEVYTKRQCRHVHRYVIPAVFGPHMNILSLSWLKISAQTHEPIYWSDDREWICVKTCRSGCPRHVPAESRQKTIIRPNGVRALSPP